MPRSHRAQQLNYILIKKTKTKKQLYKERKLPPHFLITRASYNIEKTVLLYYIFTTICSKIHNKLNRGASPLATAY